jgi:hypothetical protein
MSGDADFRLVMSRATGRAARGSGSSHLLGCAPLCDLQPGDTVITPNSRAPAAAQDQLERVREAAEGLRQAEEGGAAGERPAGAA